MALDAVGFALLAWDILPEYRLNRVARQVAQSTHFADEVRRHKPAPDWQIDSHGNDEIEQARRQYRESLAQSLRITAALARLELESAAKYLGVADHPKVKPLVLGAFDQVSYAAAAVVVGEALERRMSGMAHRVRPPIRLAIAFVVLGYILQAWGTVPITG